MVEIVNSPEQLRPFFDIALNSLKGSLTRTLIQDISNIVSRQNIQEKSPREALGLFLLEIVKQEALSKKSLLDDLVKTINKKRSNLGRQTLNILIAELQSDSRAFSRKNFRDFIESLKHEELGYYDARYHEFTALKPWSELPLYREIVEDALIKQDEEKIADLNFSFKGLIFTIIKNVLKIVFWPLIFILSLPFKLANYIAHKKWVQRGNIVQARLEAGELTPPEQDIVYVASKTENMDSKCYYVLKDGRLWYKPIAAQVEHANAGWKLLGYDGRPIHCDEELLEISTDGDNLVALGKSGHVHYMHTDRIDFVITDTGWQERRLDLQWTDAWFCLPVVSNIVNFFKGRYLTLPEGTRVFTMSNRGVETLYTRDIRGKKDQDFIPCTSILALAKNGRIYFADPWLPRGFSYEITAPEDGQFIADNMASAASVHFLIRLGRDGQSTKMYTRAADFNLINADPFYKVTYDKDDLKPRYRVMPCENWLEQPEIPLEGDAKITSRIAIMQTGRGQEHRQLRVLGTDKHGNVGYYHKFIFEKTWAFEATPGATIQPNDYAISEEKPLEPAVHFETKELKLKTVTKFSTLPIKHVELSGFLRHGLNERGLNTQIFIELASGKKLELGLHAYTRFTHILGFKKNTPYWKVTIPKEYRESIDSEVILALKALGVNKDIASKNIDLKELSNGNIVLANHSKFQIVLQPKKTNQPNQQESLELLETRELSAQNPSLGLVQDLVLCLSARADYQQRREDDHMPTHCRLT